MSGVVLKCIAHDAMQVIYPCRPGRARRKTPAWIVSGHQVEGMRGSGCALKDVNGAASLAFAQLQCGRRWTEAPVRLPSDHLGSVGDSSQESVCVGDRRVVFRRRHRLE